MTPGARFPVIYARICHSSGGASSSIRQLQATPNAWETAYYGNSPDMIFQGMVPKTGPASLERPLSVFFRATSLLPLQGSSESCFERGMKCI